MASMTSMASMASMASMQLFTGIQYLKMDIVNNCGHDNQNYTTRLGMFDSWFGSVSANTPKQQIKDLIKAVDAESPVQVYAGLLAYQKTLKGEPTGYRVSYDAVCSGAQIMSALMAEEAGLEYTTGMKSGQRPDLYLAVLQKYQAISKDTSTITRKDIKQCVMTSLYGSTATPKRILGTDNYMYFVEAMSSLFPGIWALNWTLLDTWNTDQDYQSVVYPDGFKYYSPNYVDNTISIQGYPIKVKIRGSETKSKSEGANIIHGYDSMIAREMVRRCNYDKPKCAQVHQWLKNYTFDKTAAQSLLQSENLNGDLSKLIKLHDKSHFLTIKIVEHINSQEDVNILSQEHQSKLSELLDKVLSYKPFELAVIHDCFTGLANNMNYVRYWYNNILANLVNSTCLEFTLGQTNQVDLTIDPMKHERKRLANLVSQANYSIC